MLADNKVRMSGNEKKQNKTKQQQELKRYFLYKTCNEEVSR